MGGILNSLLLILFVCTQIKQSSSLKSKYISIWYSYNSKIYFKKVNAN